MRPKSFGTFAKQVLHDLHLPRVPTYLTKLGVRLKTFTSSFYGGNLNRINSLYAKCSSSFLTKS